MSLHHEDVLQILALLDASDFDELRLETNDYKLYLRRSAPYDGAVDVRPQARPAPIIADTREPQRATVAAETPTPAPQAPVSTPQSETKAIVSPMVGVFYASPQPGAAPFVQPGSLVDVDTIVGIVEVMKLMNAVPAGLRGVVTEVVARDGDLVEYGEILVRVAPAAT